MVSIIIPMYNAESSIINCLNSIKNQTAKTLYEIIVINDGSTDSSRELVEQFKRENKNLDIKLLNTANRGVSAARNEGLKIAQHPYIAFLDSDDSWLPFKIEKQLLILQKHNNIDFLGSIISEKPFKRFLLRKAEYLIPISLIDLLFQFCFQPSTMIFKKEILKKVGYFNENQYFAEDGHFVMKIAFNNYKCVLINEKLTIFGNGIKQPFGDFGLSANLKGMQAGEINNHKFALQALKVNFHIYFLARLYSTLKYYRRILIVTFRKIKSTIPS